MIFLYNDHNINVGSQVTDVIKAEREGRMMVIWGANEKMTVDSVQEFFDHVHGPAKGSVNMIEPKRAYAPSNQLYVMITHEAVAGSDDAASAALMSELIKCESQAQSRYQSQAITFKKSKSRIERAALTDSTISQRVIV